MSYNVRPAVSFQRATKRLLKRYPSLKYELTKLTEELIENPTLGTSLGRSCFKIRLAIGSKDKGRSGGARIITYVAVLKEEIVLLTIYDKAERADLRPNELLKLLEE